MKALRPDILCHPHIPKPLHGVNPRSIMGQQWWDEERKKAYASTDYHCIACGVHKSAAKKHKWLEAHEFWSIDYKSGICEISEIVPLCHYCHNFIHSGRLSVIAGDKIAMSEAKEILEHGMEILSKNGLKCFPFTLSLAKGIGCRTFGVEPYALAAGNIKWGDWVLKWDGREYKSAFKSEAQWANHYSNHGA